MMQSVGKWLGYFTSYSESSVSNTASLKFASNAVKENLIKNREHNDKTVLKTTILLCETVISWSSQVTPTIFDMLRIALSGLVASAVSGIETTHDAYSHLMSSTGLVAAPQNIFPSPVRTISRNLSVSRQVLMSCLTLLTVLLLLLPLPRDDVILPSERWKSESERGRADCPPRRDNKKTKYFETIRTFRMEAATSAIFFETQRNSRSNVLEKRLHPGKYNIYGLWCSSCRKTNKQQHTSETFTHALAISSWLEAQAPERNLWAFYI